MKVLFCAYDRPQQIASGPNAWIQRLIPDLINIYKIDVVSLFYYHGMKEECPTVQYFKEAGLPFKTISIAENPYIEDQVFHLLKAIKRLKITVLVANLVAPAFYAGEYLKKSNLPVVGVLHSYDPFYLSVINKFLGGKQSEAIDAVISVSQYINALAREKNKYETKQHIISCGTPIQTSKTKVFNNTIEIVYAGRLVIEAKQILKLTQAFIDAALQNSRLKFFIYGSGPQEEDVKELIEQCGLQERIIMKGAVPPNQIIDKLSQHHIFTLLSDYEGMPIALMEAMSCGLVPVCLDRPKAIKEIIEDGSSGLLVKDRQTDYQEKLNFLLQNPHEWRRMSLNAINTIKNKYSSDITHREWAELLQSYKGLPTKKVKIPFNLKIKGESLPYGDIRKSSFNKRIKKEAAKVWFSFRLFIRPRARLKALFQK